YSRKNIQTRHDSIDYRQIRKWPAGSGPEPAKPIPYWICLAPIWILPDYFDQLASHGAKRVVALSSTSRFSKSFSTDVKEQELALRLAQSEDLLKTWAESHGIEWIIFRPTLIYGHARDKNITEIARFIVRFRFFPLLGSASGLRQPIHADDVAQSCLTALTSPSLSNRAYTLSGGETLTYKEMVIRIFESLQVRPRLIPIPLEFFKLAIACLRVFPRFRHWSTAMAERMNTDLSFDHSEAKRVFNFSPRPFRLSGSDLPGAN
ncbi:MAG: NAD(P)H-binding protein, partial [Gammaproteobacteria bacterium]